MANAGSEVITYRQWDSALRRIENDNIKRNGRSLTCGSMRGGDLVIENRPLERTMVVTADWRQILKQRYIE